MGENKKSVVVVCGFMGSGKTTLGGLLAKRLGMEFIDLDSICVAEMGMPVAEIFRVHGEQGFRDAEHRAALSIVDRKNLVVGSGGGTLVYERNIIPLRQCSTVVYLNPGFEVCYSRIKDTDRPIVKRNTKEQLEQVYNERAVIYKAASHLEASVLGTPDECADELVALLKDTNCL